MSTWTLQRSLIARKIKAGYPPDHPEIIALRVRLRELLVVDQVRKIIDAAAPLTPEQRQAITELVAS